MLEFKNVVKRYSDGNIAVENLNFQIDDGEFVFVVGTSGAGKSTIIRLILNIEKSSQGHVYFNNQDVSKLKGRKLAYLRRQIGVVFQDFKLLQKKTVFENISFVLEVAREKKTNIKKKVNDVLDLVGLTDKANKFPSELSGGEQQRVAIARALVNDPLLLIADEPTGNLDADNAWDTFQLINKVNNWGTTVLVVTHDNEIVDSLQKRVIKLEKGRIIRDSIGGYMDEHKMKSEKDNYVNHKDNFPDKGESFEEYKERKGNKKTSKLETSKESELKEIYDDFEEKEELAQELSKAAAPKRKKEEEKEKKSRLKRHEVDDEGIGDFE